MKFTKIQLYIIFTFLGILILPIITLAISHEYYDDPSDQGNYTYRQRLGTGLDFTIENYSQYAKPATTGDDLGVEIQFVGYSDEYSTIVVDCNSTDGDIDFIAGGSKQQYTWDSWETGGDCTFNPNYYYDVRVIISGSYPWGGFEQYRAYNYGDEIITYDSNTCAECFNLASVGFVINTEPPNTSTRIETVTPYNEEMTATSTTFSVGSTGHINTETYEEDTTVDIKIWNNAYNSSQLAIVNMYDSTELPVNKNFSFDISTGGDYSVSTTTNIQQIGLYYMTTKINHPLFSFWGFDIGTQTIVSTTTSFTVATTTQYDIFSQEVNASVENLINSSSQFTCEFDFTSLFSFNEMKECVAFLFVPNFQVINEEITGVKSDILIKFPIGYVTDLANIFSNNTATSSLPVLSATLPSALGIGSPTIELSFSHVFDYILEADGGDFTTSSSTFYETTSYYWKIFVYLMTFFYLLGRIIKRFSINLNYI